MCRQPSKLQLKGKESQTIQTKHYFKWDLVTLRLETYEVYYYRQQQQYNAIYLCQSATH